MDQTCIGINLLNLAYSLKPAQGILCVCSNLVYNKSQSHTLCSDDLVLSLIINPNEKITRILRMIEVKQNGVYVSCRGLITRDHAVVSSGRPRHYYHKYCAVRLNII
jgi:hypothetical protein